VYKLFFKRIFDIIISLFSIVILSPLIVVLAICIYIGMGSPILFTQERIGKNEKVFKMYKFRSMNSNKDKDGNLLPERMRLTKLGSFLRSTSLDELPELYNILKGEMSFIGPRPLPLYYLPYFYEKERKRHSVCGGLVPPDVLSGKAITSWEEQFEYEMNYSKDVSLLLDIKIVLFTLLVLARRFKGNYGSEFRPHLNEYRSKKIEVVKK
jgi:undecaprenyl phosphate N,N'-diacetylbacillosamine 1-phosphate transferase